MLCYTLKVRLGSVCSGLIISVCLIIIESLHNIKTYTAPQSPGILCILCEFNVTSEAQGCEATIMEEAMTHQTSTTIRESDIIFNMTVISDGGQGSMPIEAFDCISDLPTGNFTIQVREVECSGGIGLREFIRQHIRLQGLDRQPDGKLEILVHVLWYNNSYAHSATAILSMQFQLTL